MPRSSTEPPSGKREKGGRAGRKARRLVPGTPVAGSTTGKPLVVLFELLGQRLALRVLWELREGRMTFRMLQARCDQPSPTVLNKRLAELRAAGIVEHEPGAGYGVTTLGAGLLAALQPLNKWAHKWAHELADAVDDPDGRAASRADGG